MKVFRIVPTKTTFPEREIVAETPAAAAGIYRFAECDGCKIRSTSMHGWYDVRLGEQSVTWLNVTPIARLEPIL